MNLRRRPTLRQCVPVSIARIAAASVVCGAASFAHAATDNYSATGAEGQVFGAYALPDGCTTGYLEIVFSAQGTNSLNPQSTTPFAFAYIFGQNNCTHTYSFEDGYTNTLTFSASGNGSQLPPSITASGQIPMSGSSGADNLTFQITQE